MSNHKHKCPFTGDFIVINCPYLKDNKCENLPFSQEKGDAWCHIMIEEAHAAIEREVLNDYSKRKIWRM